MTASKAAILARLATARAGLWCSLLGIGEDLLNTQPVAGAWTARDTLAHLAAWDDLRSDHLGLLLDGRAAEIAYLPDPINERIYAERHDWTLERVVNAALAARARFLAAADALTDDAIARTVTLGSGEQTTLAGWVLRRARHDHMHAAPILDWRAANPPEPDAPGPRIVLLAALNACRAALLAWGDTLPAAELTGRPVCGAWTYQDVLGHVADWEAWFVRGLHAMADGRSGGVDFDGDEQAWNQAHAAARQGQPYDLTLGDCTRLRAGLLTLLQGFDDARLATAALAPMPGMQHYYAWFAGAALHEYEHAQIVEQALAPAGA